MPRLLAIIPEDGWAMVREGDAIFFIRPPFRSSERVPVPEAALGDAISLHGYEAQPDAPDEPWTQAVERIREIMARSRASVPPDSELLARILRSGPVLLLTELLDRIDREWLEKGDLRAADSGLKALLAEERVKSDRALLDRVLALRQRLDDLRDAREATVPMRLPPHRLELISKRPEVDGFKSRIRNRGSAAMVNAGS